MWERWDDPRLPILVLDNGDLNEVTCEQREMEGDPMFPASQQVPSMPYADYARLRVLDGIRVDAPDDVGDAWDAALSVDRPSVIHAVVDPAVPPMPPRLEPERREKLLSGLEREGTPLAARAPEAGIGGARRPGAFPT